LTTRLDGMQQYHGVVTPPANPSSGAIFKNGISSKVYTQSQLHHNNNFTAITGTGASHHYCHGKAPTTTFTSNAPPTMVNIANGKRIQSTGQAKLLLPDLPPGTEDCHIMSTFSNNLLSMGRFCDAGCTVIFTGTNVKVINKTGPVILQGFCEQVGARMWRFNIYPITPPAEAHAAAHTSPGHINHPHEPHVILFDDDHHDQPASQPLAIRHAVPMGPPTAPPTIYKPTTTCLASVSSTNQSAQNSKQENNASDNTRAPTTARATTRATPTQSTEHHHRA
jgi:hypothetical protein